MSVLTDGWYQLDTGWGCGGIRVKDDEIVETAPIFKKYVGLLAYKIAAFHKVTPLGGNREVVN